MTKVTEQLKIVIDFDSTFTKVEGLDELADISLRGQADRAQVVAQIRHMTDRGMAGELSFEDSLKQRVQILRANRSHIQDLVEHLSTKISDSFLRNEAFISEYSDSIYIVSSGFKEFIVPIVTSMGVKEENVYANTFTFDAEGNITGYDESNLLSKNKGKVKLLNELNFEGDVYVIGDGYTDYELREAGLANKFFAFTENIEREKVTAKADHVVKSLDEFLYLNNLSRSQSYPKSRIKVLLLENVHKKAIDAFRKEGFQVELIKGALDEDELCERIKDVSILGIRSKTLVTKKVLDNANKLLAIGAFCIGTNQINLSVAEEKGIAVFNAPYSNTRSVVELAIGEIIMLVRNITDKSARMHTGVWDKSATNSFEIRGKKLGLVGYGNIGKQLSVVAEALGMEVYFYDLIDGIAMGNAKKCDSLDEVLQVADVVSLHVDGRKSNANLISHREFNLMKDGVIFLNLSRGHIVDIEALAENIKSRKVWGAAVDVFPYEPKTNDEEFINQLRGLPNTILTPHIGGSTEEAQANIGEYVPNKLLSFVNKGDTFGAVNFPELQLPMLENAHRLLHVHANVPGVMSKINTIYAKHHINIVGQYLKTSGTVGYVITDISKSYTDEMIQELRNIPETIKFRMLY
jgi:D-3-phosphoglycerate dehydrogenase / 2-oxoglutarate reductase